MARSSATAAAVRCVCVVSVLLLAAAGGPPAGARQALPQTPEQFFGFRIGTDGELARYPKILDYLQHLSQTTSRLKYQELGRTTMGNPYVLATISSPENLARIEKLKAISRRLADPRGLTEADAKRMAQEGRPFYFLYATIHSTEVGNTQALTEIVHRLATDSSPDIRQILDNIVLLVVPSQNPDGQLLVIDHWYKTKGTPLARVYPDLYHKYVGHDDNRDWFTFTQVETRLAVEKVHSVYKPVITHDMHQMGAGGVAYLRAAVRRSLRSQHPSDPGAGDDERRPGDGVGARRGRQDRRRVSGPVRSVGARAAVHGLPRPGAHPERDRERRSRGSVREPGRERCPARSAGAALELPALQERRVASPPDRGLRRHGRARRDVPRREVPDDVARELSQGPRRLGEQEGAAVRVRASSRAARSVRDVRAARHASHWRGGDPSGEGGVRGRRPAVRRRFVGHPDGAAVRRVREDHAGAADDIRISGCSRAVLRSRRTT